MTVYNNPISRDFKDIFGTTMRDLSKEMFVTSEYISQVFRGINHNKKFIERLAIRLTELAKENYENEIAMAKYKKKKADAIVKQLFDMLGEADNE